MAYQKHPEGKRGWERCQKISLGVNGSKQIECSLRMGHKIMPMAEGQKERDDTPYPLLEKESIKLRVCVCVCGGGWDGEEQEMEGNIRK